MAETNWNYASALFEDVIALAPKAPYIMATEYWAAVPGYVGFYEVSTLGRIRRIAKGQGARLRILKPQSNNDGYKTMRLCMHGVCKNVSMHRLVAKAFIGPIPPKWCINHLDGNPANNALTNLEITTYSGNMIHAIRCLGHKPTAQKGSKNGVAKLTEEQVAEIRKAPIKRGTATMFAGMYGVSVSLITRIIKGHAWKHVK